MDHYYGCVKFEFNDISLYTKKRFRVETVCKPTENDNINAGEHFKFLWWIIFGLVITYRV